MSHYPINCGRNVEKTRIIRPTTRTAIVFCEQPFHSLSMIPHTLENVTLSAMRIQKARVIRVGDSVRKPLPRDSPKNWLYHRAPAKRQNNALLPHTEVFA